MMLYNMIGAQEMKAHRCRFKDKSSAAVFSHLSLAAVEKGSNMFRRQSEARPHVHPSPAPTG